MNEFTEYFEMVPYISLLTCGCLFICMFFVLLVDNRPLKGMTAMDFWETFCESLKYAVIFSLLIGLILCLSGFACMGLEYLGIDPADLPVSDHY